MVGLSTSVGECACGIVATASSQHYPPLPPNPITHPPHPTPPPTLAVLWRCFSQLVVFLYLLDEKTSLLVLVPAGVAGVIEVG